MEADFEVFCFSFAQCHDRLSVACKMLDFQLLLQHRICLYTAMLPVTIIMDRISETKSEPPEFNVFFIRVTTVMGSLHSKRNPKTPDRYLNL